MTSVVMIICWWDLFHMTWLPSGTCACLLVSQNARCREISFDGTMKNSVCMAWCTLAKWKVNEELPAVINRWYHFGGLQLIIHDLGVLSDSCWLTKSIMQDLILLIILVACDIISYGVLTWSLFIHSCWNGFTTPIPYSLNSHLELMEVIMSFLPGFVPTWSEPGGALSWSEVVCASPNVQSISRISSWTTSVLALYHRCWKWTQDCHPSYMLMTHSYKQPVQDMRLLGCSGIFKQYSVECTYCFDWYVQMCLFLKKSYHYMDELFQLIVLNKHLLLAVFALVLKQIAM